MRASVRFPLAVALGALCMAGCGPHLPWPPRAATAPASPAGATIQADAPAPACVVVDGRADARCTPGATNPAVTQKTIKSTICRKGWTATVRPPVAVTNRIKAEQMRRYGLPGPASLYEEDHLIPLEVGGAPGDPANLYPEAYAGTQGARVKDAEENALNRAVCSGRMTLAAARAKILADWTHR